MSKFLIIAYRGASAYEPENTLRSVKKALELGADMVEVDVRASRDGYIVMMHDPVVDRTTNRKGHLKDMTLKELKKSALTRFLLNATYTDLEGFLSLLLH